ncbi:hypothetical protein WSK_3178 [Novosphingobium sp. Rr 2-17]|uniref:hypothetical protein n=1 Tax=Novosphingobium sp. Rr 2-17 TaxID=555793 RepID=UPI0002698567|nr:hypothetical protein [Novosphingobium sp. Rr 2-17]EIZ78296.1 hypothetical protein WSK_3178 [Novosphingobium sp. Rr 2-17]
MMGTDLAAAALTLVGVPFRLHGRDSRVGLDCIGVLEAALKQCGASIRLPNGYTLRSRTQPDLTGLVAKIGMAPAGGDVRTGDVLMLRPSLCQHHLVIATGRTRVVHAHAGLRRVVEALHPAAWPIVAHWRFAPTSTSHRS